MYTLHGRDKERERERERERVNTKNFIQNNTQSVYIVCVQ